MNKFLAALIIGFALSIAGIFILAPTPPSPWATANVVTTSPGGDIWEFMAKYNGLEDEHQYLKIVGPCASACTYFEGLVERDHVCAGPHAVFGFHGVYDGLGTFKPATVAWVMPLVYTAKLRDLLKQRGFDGTQDVDRTKYPMGVIWLTADDIGIQRCPT